MRFFNPILVTFAALARIRASIPFKPGIESAGRWLTKPVGPTFSISDLGQKAKMYQFHTATGWEATQSVSHPGASEVLHSMKRDGLFTAVVLKDTKLMCVGFAEGKTTPDKFVISDAKDNEEYLLTNGGFFVTGSDPHLRKDYNAYLLDSASVMHFSVGMTSVSNNQVDVPGVHSDLYHKLEGDDGSYMVCGPDLREAIDSSDPDWSKPNTKARRLHYFPRDERGNKIHSIVWDELVKYDRQLHDLLQSKAGAGLENDLEALNRLGKTSFSMREVTWCDRSPGRRITETIPIRAADGSNEFIRTVFAHIPGGVATMNQENERAVLVLVEGGVKVVCAYTSQRALGMTINEMRDVIDVFLQKFTKASTPISATKQALNLDGGGSTFIGWVKNGKLRVLASGGLTQQNPGIKDPEGMKFRNVTTMVKHVLLDEEDKKV